MAITIIIIIFIPITIIIAINEEIITLDELITSLLKIIFEVECCLN